MKLSITRAPSTSSGHRHALAIGALSLLVAASTGCGGAVVDDDDDEGGETSSTTSALSLATSEFQLAYHGGGGGSPADVACAPGDVAVGLHGSSQYEQNLASLDLTSRRLVTRVGLVCAHLEADGRLTGMYTTAALGGPTNNYNADPEPFSLRCPAGQVIHGIEGRVGRFLDAIGPFCRPVPYERPSAPPSDKFALQNGAANLGGPWTGIAGGDGGERFSSTCPTGYVVRRLTVRSGSWVDGVQAHCAEIVGPPPSPPPPAAPQAPVLSKPITRPGSGGGMFFCPSCRR